MNIAYLCKLQGVTVKQIAEKLNMSPGWTSMLLNGHWENESAMKDVAQILGVTYEEITNPEMVKLFGKLHKN